MPLGFLTENFSISLRKFMTIFFMFSSNLAWFLVFYNRFDEIFEQFITDIFLLNVGNALFLTCVIISALIASVIAEKVNRRRFLFWLTILGVSSSIPIILFGNEISFL